MIETEGRKSDFIANIIMKRPENQDYDNPANDVVKWFHIKIEPSKLFTCIYQIIDTEKSSYGIPFKARISLLESEILELIKENALYKIYRGPEEIGTLELVERL